MHTQETWKNIEGFDGYQISSLGRVKSVKFGKERILKPRKNNCGYLRVGLCEDGKQEWYLVHRLVANAFIPNSNNLPEVNHIDKDRTNNKVDNLEWCDSTYNNRYSLSKPVNQFTLDGRFIRRWECMNEIQYQLGFRQGHIWSCCQGIRKSAYKYIWRYAHN